MAGVYTDNQPDFSHLAPGETKTFCQYWYPVAGTGPVVAATLDAALGVEVEAGRTTLRFDATHDLGATTSIVHDQRPAGRCTGPALDLGPDRRSSVVLDTPDPIPVELRQGARPCSAGGPRDATRRSTGAGECARP